MIFGWVMYDFANSAYTTLVALFLTKIHTRSELCLYWGYREVRGKRETLIIC
jgi:hypothetical protein